MMVDLLGRTWTADRDRVVRGVLSRSTLFGNLARAAALLLTLLPGPLTLSSANAHPVPRDNHDRTLIVRLTPEAVLVDYRLEVGELRAALDLARDDLGTIEDRVGFAELYARSTSETLARSLLARLDGKELTFTCVRYEPSVLDHLRCDFQFRAGWQLASGQPHQFFFREGNYAEDDFSQLRVYLNEGGGIQLQGSEVPPAELMARSGLQLGPGDAERLRRVSATLVLVGSEPKGRARPALPPEVSPYRSPPGLRSAGPVARTRPPPAAVVAWAKGVRSREKKGQTEGAPPSPTLLGWLLDTWLDTGILLLLAGSVGAIHGLTPRSARLWRAASQAGGMGGSEACATVRGGHPSGSGLWTLRSRLWLVNCASVAAFLVLAGLLHFFFSRRIPAETRGWPGLIGGLLVVGLGLCLVFRRQFPPRTAAPGEKQGRPGWWERAASWDFVPCWDAIALLCFAISAQGPWLGWPLVLAFSAGLAGGLAASATAVGYARRAVADRWSEGIDCQALGLFLPLLSAVLVTALGLWLCYDRVRTVPWP
jgi:hypothetical protein